MNPKPSMETIEAAIETAGSIRKAAPIFGVDERTVRRWLAEYKRQDEDPGETGKTSMRILAIDIETRPLLSYHWGMWNQNIRAPQVVEWDGMICWAAKWLGEPDSMVFRSDFHDGHETMVRGAWLMMNAADAVVHYNGGRFDNPWLQREFAQLDLDLPAPYKQIDLLKTVKKQFRFPSNKLGDVAPLLGLEEKVKHEGFELWIKCLQNDPDAWERMRAYNVQDVELLEQMYNRLHKYIVGHPSFAAFHGRDICPTCGSEHLKPAGLAYLKTGQYPRFKCDDCGRYSRDSKRTGSTRIQEAA